MIVFLYGSETRCDVTASEPNGWHHTGEKSEGQSGGDAKRGRKPPGNDLYVEAFHCQTEVPESYGQEGGDGPGQSARKSERCALQNHHPPDERPSEAERLQDGMVTDAILHGQND